MSASNQKTLIMTIFFNGAVDVCQRYAWYPKFNSSHFGVPLYSIDRITRLGGNLVWAVQHVDNFTFPFADHSQTKAEWSKRRWVLGIKITINKLEEGKENLEKVMLMNKRHLRVLTGASQFCYLATLFLRIRFVSLSRDQSPGLASKCFNTNALSVEPRSASD